MHVVHLLSKYYVKYIGESFIIYIRNLSLFDPIRKQPTCYNASFLPKALPVNVKGMQARDSFHGSSVATFCTMQSTACISGLLQLNISLEVCVMYADILSPSFVSNCYLVTVDFMCC